MLYLSRAKHTFQICWTRNSLPNLLALSLEQSKNEE